MSQAERWRVDTAEGVFETDLETLKQWIVEGCVLPTDKVSKGSLSWIDAGRAPMLRSAFAGETPAAQPPTRSDAVVTSTLTTDISSQTDPVPSPVIRSVPEIPDSSAR
ncbi:MAG: hypothetical protein ACRD9S_11105, partial [Pyrinomonadaceae bacterium]